MHALRDAFAGFAEWAGYPHPERAEAWLSRLALNEPEITMLHRLPPPAAAAYRASPTVLLAPDGSRRVEAASLRADAAAAIGRAREQTKWQAFNWVVDRVPDHGQGLLAGVPVAVKDLMAVAGMPLTGGSAALEPVFPSSDAEVVARIRRAGAVIIGATNLHELAYGITSDNPHFGRVVNPVAPSRIAGGSSGGSAAAIAAGIVQLAVGSDTAGSIRIPAACCGIVGLKPSYDVLPRSGVMDLAPSLDHVGPMADSVAACAHLFAAMLGLATVPDWSYPDSAGCRVARLSGYFDSPLNAEVRAALDAAVQALAQDGAACTTASIDGAETAAALQFNTICPEATQTHAQLLLQSGHRLGQDVRVRLEIGHFLPGHWYVKAQRLRQQLADSMAAAFHDADFLLCPTLRTPPPAVNVSHVEIAGCSYPMHTVATNLTMPFNLTGLPAITVPWDRTEDGLPIGLQIVGKPGADWQVLGMAQRLETLSPWREQQSNREQ